jgi:hypothetical protein
MLQKTKLACALSALAVLASCAGGPQSTVTPPPVFAPPPTPTKLRVLYRVLYSGTDRMTSVDFGERNAYSFDGEIYYSTYVITESLQNVTARMDDLYRTGVH